MTEKIKEYLNKNLGAAYVYGGVGRVCSPNYLRMRINQYPEFEAKTRQNCPVLSKIMPSCTGCKYEGKNVFDCAQLVRRALLCADISLPSGATSQWKSGKLYDKRTIDSIDKDKLCLVFIEKKGRMAHVGIYLGDGYVIDARGYGRGVIKSELNRLKWTHCAKIKGLYDEEGQEIQQEIKEEKREKMEQKNIRLYQELLEKLGFSLAPFGVDGKMGAVTRATLKLFQKLEGIAQTGEFDAISLCHLFYKGGQIK